MNLSDAQIQEYCDKVYDLVEECIRYGDAPFAALLLNPEGEAVLVDRNRKNTLNNRTAHGEVLLLTEATKQFGRKSFKDWGIFINAEPCAMCMSLLIHADINNFYWGADTELERVNPHIPVEVFQQYSDQKLNITRGINKDVFATQLSQFR